MTDVVYIPMKAPDGAILGHARVDGGFFTLQLRRPLCGQAVALTDSGSFSGEIGSRIAAAGRVQAVAALDGDRLLCWGAARGANATYEEVRRRLTTLQPQPQSIPPTARPAAPQAAPEKPEPEPEPEALPAMAQDAADENAPPAVPECARQAQPEKAPEPAPAAIGEAPPAPESAPAADREAVSAEYEPQADFPAARAAGPEPPAQEQEPVTEAPGAPENSRRLLRFAQAPEGTQAEAPSVADSTADSESFMALLRRADAVFQDLESPQAPLIHVAGQRSAARRESVRVLEDASTAARDASDFSDRPHPAVPAPPHLQAWNEQVDALLSAPAPIAREHVANPFPHIFPGAQFSRLTGNGVMEHLEGDWISGSERCRILAVRGDYSPQPPRHLFGFTRYIRTHIGGFWVKVISRG